MKKFSPPQRFLFLSLVLFLVMVCTAVFNKEGILTVYRFQGDLAELKENNRRLMDENLTLRREIEELKTDPYVIEKIAREKLNLVKPGEKVYQLVRENGQVSIHP